ncbi:MAG: DNA repair protein RecN [Alphaproteobacteria bacterium]|nr:DNA repair protein RecN [Alphaproteobacteria bacterium]
MLAHLTIKNIVLIETLDIEFQEGLSALTGETGAGKSILLDSLGLALGARADSNLVRSGTDQGSVTAVFEVARDHPVLGFLQAQSLEVETTLIFRRHINADGRSKAYINDQPVSVNLMRQAGALLVEIHGQFDTHSLLNPKTHLHMFDSYALAQAQIEEVRFSWKQWKSSERKFEEERTKIEKARQDIDYYRTSLDDLDALSLKENEEEELSIARETLMRRDKIIDSLGVAESKVQQIEDISGKLWRALENMGKQGKPITEALDRSHAEIQEVRAMLHDLSGEMESGERSLEEIDDRLFALKTQARKHECNIDDLLGKREEISDLLDKIESDDASLLDLEKQVQENREIYLQKAKEISKIRQSKVQDLSKKVCQELVPLKLEKARFEVAVTQVEETNWREHGIDQVEFLISTNPGTPLGPLQKIASGGEMARFMLALKVVLAERGQNSTLIFDEVDSGVGGATAAAVGERLARLADHSQILVVTHSPQVAATASHHWIVTKSGKDIVTTTIIPLEKPEKRREEIARMLAGAEVTGEARAAADKLLEANAA